LSAPDATGGAVKSKVSSPIDFSATAARLVCPEITLANALMISGRADDVIDLARTNLWRQRIIPIELTALLLRGEADALHGLGELP
jgi:hypothetical protein